jgi:hypothetical protein
MARGTGGDGPAHTSQWPATVPGRSSLDSSIQVYLDYVPKFSASPNLKSTRIYFFVFRGLNAATD